jgi:hypothetical protein
MLHEIANVLKEPMRAKMCALFIQAGGFTNQDYVELTGHVQTTINRHIKYMERMRVLTQVKIRQNVILDLKPEFKTVIDQIFTSTNWYDDPEVKAEYMAFKKMIKEGRVRKYVDNKKYA